MPILDLADLIDDPDFADDTGTLFLRRTGQAVGNNGRVQASPAATPLHGVVTQADGDALKLLPEGARAEGAIVVHTRTRLYVASDTHQADQVLWQDQTYTVGAVANWSTFGSGFCAAVCTLKSLTGPSPA